jgi:hypothetical protein
MGCRTVSAGFERMLRERGYQFVDAAMLVPCHERVLYRYVSGRQHLPRVEARLATMFRMSVPALRRVVWSREHPNTRRGRHAEAAVCARTNH